MGAARGLRTLRRGPILLGGLLGFHSLGATDHPTLGILTTGKGTPSPQSTPAVHWAHTGWEKRTRLQGTYRKETRASKTPQ